MKTGDSTFNTVLAFGGRAESDNGLIEATDGAALVMVGLVFFILGAFAMWFWQMSRRARTPLSPGDELIEELETEQRNARLGGHRQNLPDADSWERDDDWWRV